MNTLQKRFLAFLLLCIPVRIAFVFIAKSVDKKYLPYLGYIGLIIGLGFMYNFIFTKKRGGTFNQIAWWNDLRPVHSIFYLIFASLALSRNNEAYIPLLYDVILGFISFVSHHYIEGSFGKLI